jgi:hypothetical protein
MTVVRIVYQYYHTALNLIKAAVWSRIIAIFQHNKK